LTKLPSTLVFDHPTIRDIVDVLESRIDPGALPDNPAILSKDVDLCVPESQHKLITGLASRLASISTMAEMWSSLLLHGVDSVTPIPSSISLPEVEGASNINISLHGSFLGDYPQDLTFFNISDMETLAMIPQQRVILEVGYQAL
jgi:hypothetical protein